jgi:hypothetical protein
VCASAHMSKLKAEIEPKTTASIFTAGMGWSRSDHEHPVWALSGDQLTMKVNGVPAPKYCLVESHNSAWGCVTSRKQVAHRNFLFISLSSRCLWDSQWWTTGRIPHRETLLCLEGPILICQAHPLSPGSHLSRIRRRSHPYSLKKKKKLIVSLTPSESLNIPLIVTSPTPKSKKVSTNFAIGC